MKSGTKLWNGDFFCIEHLKVPLTKNKQIGYSKVADILKW